MNGCKTVESFQMQSEFYVVGTFKILIMIDNLKYFKLINFATLIEISTKAPYPILLIIIFLNVV